jgi:hypothetical protein
MKSGLQFGKWLAALGICVALASPGLAQHGAANGQQNRPPKQGQNQQKPHPQAAQQQRQQAQREAQRNANRPPQANPPREVQPASRPNNLNRPLNAYAPPPRTATPQERQRNEQQFNRLPPQQKQEMRDRAQTWQKLSPQQRDHIKNDVLPRWRQLPPDRQRAIQQRLGVLKNMPESARNQHLNDPNFTRGMSAEDKATLRDLSHLHVGGAPEPPSE